MSSSSYIQQQQNEATLYAAVAVGEATVEGVKVLSDKKKRVKAVEDLRDSIYENDEDDDYYDLYDEGSMKAIEPFDIKPAKDGFFVIVGKNFMNFCIVIINSLFSFIQELSEVQREKARLVKHYWHSANDVFEPELTVQTKDYVDRNNYKQYLDAVDNTSFFKILLKNYWSYLYLMVVIIVFIIQVMYWMGYSETSPKWGFIFTPLILFILNKTFHKYGV